MEFIDLNGTSLDFALLLLLPTGMQLTELTCQLDMDDYSTLTEYTTRRSRTLNVLNTTFKKDSFNSTVKTGKSSTEW